MNCPNCKKTKIRAFIHVQMYIDADDNHHLTKSAIRKKTTELVSQTHEKTSYICQNCGWTWGHPYDNLRNND